MRDYDWRPYVSMGQRRERAARKLLKLRKSGREVAPIEVVGRKIARTFWGSAWCDNLEAYSDYENRLPRGRTYVRNGSVIDLQVAGGRISALVSGSDFYEIELGISPLATKKWKRIRSQCAGRIDSLVELLQGQISDAVMEIVTRPGKGLFPTPSEISLDCSCPDWATMCKHVAAVLYGVGARLDHAPETLFTLRGVDASEMVADAIGKPPTTRRKGRGRVLAADDIAAVFGLDIDMGDETGKKPRPVRRRRGAAAEKVSSKRGSRKKARAVVKVVKKKATKKKPTRKKAVTKKAAQGAKRKSAAARTKASASKTTTRAAKRRATRKRPARG